MDGEKSCGGIARVDPEVLHLSVKYFASADVTMQGITCGDCVYRPY